MSYRDKLLALLNRWECERGRTLPLPADRDGRIVVAWIRSAMSPDVTGELERELRCARQRVGELGAQLGKTEQELRDLTRDRDRWRTSAHEAQALVRSLGIQQQTTQQRNQPCGQSLVR